MNKFFILLLIVTFFSFLFSSDPVSVPSSLSAQVSSSSSSSLAIVPSLASLAKARCPSVASPPLASPDEAQPPALAVVHPQPVNVPSSASVEDQPPAPDVTHPQLATVPSLASLARAQCPSTPVAGNIHRPEFRSFWESLRPDAYVMSIIRNGYKIPFRDGVVPHAYRERNNRSALNNMPYLQEHVESLVLDTTVSEVFTQPLCCNPLTVASRYVNGLLKLRMCIDLSRYINLLLKKEAVVLPGLEKALKLLLPGDFQATFDLKSAFHHVLIHPDDRKYLGFSIPGPSGQDRFFVFRVLPFGLASAVQLLARLTKPICIFLAAEGIRLSIYIDDGWILALLRELAAQHLRRTFEVLAMAGFIISVEKSDSPSDVSQVKKHLGFLIDSVTMTVSAPSLKLEEVNDLIRQTLAAPSCSAKQLAKVTGKIISLLPALGPIVMVLCRLAQTELAAFTEVHSWSSSITLSSEAADSLFLLADSLLVFNGYPIRNEATAIPLSSYLGHLDHDRDLSVYGLRAPPLVVASDASAHALCAYDVQGAGSLFHQAVFSEAEARLSSGHRELLAVKSALESVPSAFSQGSSVFWLTDSENLVTFLSKGSSKRPIQTTVVDIFRLTRALRLDLIPIHLRRSDYRIEVADYGSRFYDPDDWSCDASSFEELTRFWHVTIDLFAHYSNAQVSRFYSYGNSPHTSGIDAFTHSWANELAWCCPPVNLVIPALKKIASSCMQAILVIPAWRSAHFWPIIFPDGQHAIDICVSLTSFCPCIIRGPFCSNYLLQGRPAFPFLALYLRSAGTGYSGLAGSVSCPQTPYLPCLSHVHD